MFSKLEKENNHLSLRTSPLTTPNKSLTRTVPVSLGEKVATSELFIKCDAIASLLKMHTSIALWLN